MSKRPPVVLQEQTKECIQASSTTVYGTFDEMIAIDDNTDLNNETEMDQLELKALA